MSEKAVVSVTTNTLLVRVEGGRMVIPDASIAEIIDFKPTMTESDDVPTWYLGQLPWRKINIPLISFEAMNNDSFFNQSKLLKIIVIHGIYNRTVLRYWGFVALETPKIVRIGSAEITKVEDAQLGNVELMKAQYADEIFIIPDIERIEKEIIILLDLTEPVDLV